MKVNIDPTYKNYSLVKAFAILEYLAEANVPKELGIVSHDLGLNKSTVHRYLSTLEHLGYINRDTTSGRYSLSSRVVWLAFKFLDRIDLRNIARPLLERLVEVTRETVHLAILDDFDVVYIDKVDGYQPVKMASSVGKRMPAHSTGLGKALLANLSEDQWALYVEKKGLNIFTENTIHDAQQFFQHLHTARERGYAIDNCENEEGIRCIAVPIRDHTVKTIAAISISGWSMTMTPDRDVELAQLAQETSWELSKRLGGGKKTTG